MSDSTTQRERFKEATAAAVRLHQRNIIDRGMSGPDSALHLGRNGEPPGLLDVLADAAEAAYGGGAAPAARRQRAV